jgi:hypothetical protein
MEIQPCAMEVCNAHNLFDKLLRNFTLINNFRNLGGGALGHPIVYMKLRRGVDDYPKVSCVYCGVRFQAINHDEEDHHHH